MKPANESKENYSDEAKLKILCELEKENHLGGGINVPDAITKHCNEKNCHAVMVYPNGHKYEGDFNYAKFHGTGIYTWPNGYLRLK